MPQYDEFRIFITDGQSPLNNTPTQVYRQAAFCILQNPVCGNDFEIKEPLPVTKPQGIGKDSNPPSVGTTDKCPESFGYVVHLEMQRGHYVDLVELLYAVDGPNGEVIHTEVPENEKPVEVIFKVPSHFKKTGESLYTTEQPGIYAVSFTAKFNDNITCSGIFPITFV